MSGCQWMKANNDGCRECGRSAEMYVINQAIILPLCVECVADLQDRGWQILPERRHSGSSFREARKAAA